MNCVKVCKASSTSAPGRLPLCDWRGLGTAHVERVSTDAANVDIDPTDASSSGFSLSLLCGHNEALGTANLESTLTEAVASGL